MSEEWKTLAQQIADLKHRLAQTVQERDQYKAAYELQQALHTTKRRST